MKTYTFNSQMQRGGRLPEFDQNTVKNEPMLFSASPEFAIENGGPITKAFVEAFFKERPDVNPDDVCIDSRVHMLMPGWFPCIPGWHHDDIPRSRLDKQPNYDDPEWSSKHCIALINGGIAPTQFAIGKAVCTDNGAVPIYAEWHKQVERMIESGELERVHAPTNQLVHFDCDTFHQGVGAVGNGWRWFGRISYDAGYVTHNRTRHNEIRRQVNVYMENPFKGW